MSGTKVLYLGNLPLTVTGNDVRDLFAPFGEVVGVSLLRDADTGHLRGFGFVEMDPAAALVAVEALDGQEFDGRILRVNEARDRGARPPRRSW